MFNFKKIKTLENKLSEANEKIKTLENELDRINTLMNPDITAPTKFLCDASMWENHGFGLLNGEDRKRELFITNEYRRAIGKAIFWGGQYQNIKE